MSSMWVKIRRCVPGAVTGSGLPWRKSWRKISITVPYLPLRSPGPYTL